MRKITINLLIIITSIISFTCNSCEEDNSLTEEKLIQDTVFSDFKLNSINYRSVNIEGIVSLVGGYKTEKYGICYNKIGIPTINDSVIIINKNVDELYDKFTYKLQNLQPQTVYYVRLYATVEDITVYSEEIKFTTKELGFVELKTIEAKNIRATSVQSGGIITKTNGNIITERGICWGEGQNPTIYTDHINCECDSNSFLIQANGLDTLKNYFVRAYVITENEEIYYGNEINFKTVYDVVIDFDGNVYEAMKIGNQVWMVDNLKTTHYNNGEPINEGDAYSDLCEDTISKYYFQLRSTNKFYYTWAAVMNGEQSSSENPSGIQGIAPPGWHIPSMEEWIVLREYINNHPENDYSLFYENSEVGIHACVGGGYSGTGLYGYFWSSTSSSEIRSRVCRIEDYNISFTESEKGTSIMVRCLKD